MFALPMQQLVSRDFRTLVLHVIKGETAFDILIRNWMNVRELQRRMRDEPGGRNTMIMATRKVCRFSLWLPAFFSLPQTQVVLSNV